MNQNNKIPKNTDIPLFLDVFEFRISSKFLNDKIREEEISFFVQSLFDDGLNINPNYDSKYFFVVFGKSFDLIKQFCEYLEKKWGNKQLSTTGLIYEWDSSYRRYKSINNNCPKVLKEDIVGLDHHFEDIVKDITSLSNKSELMKKLGANSGYNYLLHGIPGTGKSSFVKALANLLNVPIYCVKLKSINQADLSRALCLTDIKNSTNQRFYDEYGTEIIVPKEEEEEEEEDKIDIKLVLVEDFDRYLNGDCGVDAVSELLNALDGIYPSYGVIRFFSANHPEIIAKNFAMISRMRRMLYFKEPSSEDMLTYLIKIFPNDKEDIRNFILLIEKHKFSIRIVNNYISRFILDDYPIKEAIKNYESWIEEMNKINNEI